MKCTDCPYYWKEEWEDYPCCHFDPVHHPTPSPCEYDDDDYDYDYYYDYYYREEDDCDEERW